MKAGNLDCIMVKDLSRLGRERIGVDELILRTFKEYGVRFISVSDNYDSLTANRGETHTIIPFKNLMNEQYNNDTSMKVRTSQQVKRMNGQFIGAFAPYGYKKAENNKNLLVPDPYAAGVVQGIFAKKLAGVSAMGIAKILNKNGVLFGLYRKDNTFPNLNISFDYCSFYELGPATAQYGMVFLENLKSLTFDHCLFSNSAWIKNAYLLKLMVNCPTGATYTGVATYSNVNSNTNKLSQGSNSTIKGFGVTMSFTLNGAGTDSVFGECEPAKHYFPVSEPFVESLPTVSRLGASYDTKYWIVPTSAAE